MVVIFLCVMLTSTGCIDIVGGAPDLGPFPQFDARSTVWDARTPFDFEPDGPTIDTCSPTEDCNGVDDDCDGVADENVPGGEDCDTMRPGLCAAGLSECFGGVWICRSTHTLQHETCDGRDEDCDGLVDEAAEYLPITVPCYEGAPGTHDIGVCRSGISICFEGEFGPCLDQRLPEVEVCDRVDNDCDGEVDELRCDCEDGEERPCYTGPAETEGVAPCHAGRQQCVADEQGSLIWGPCVGETLPEAEICDGQDQDCDGEPDDGVLNRCGQCGAGGINRCDGCGNQGINQCGRCGQEGINICGRCDDVGINQCGGCGNDGINQCGQCGRDGINACGQCGAPPPEICDDRDNDCDGRTDEGLTPCGFIANCRTVDLTGAAETRRVSLTRVANGARVGLITVERYETRGADHYAYKGNASHAGDITHFDLTTMAGGPTSTTRFRICLLETVGSAAMESRRVAVRPSVPPGVIRLDPDVLSLGSRVYWGQIEGVETGGDADVAHELTLGRGGDGSATATVDLTLGNANSRVMARLTELHLPRALRVSEVVRTAQNGRADDWTRMASDIPPGHESFHLVSVERQQTGSDDDMAWQVLCDIENSERACRIQVTGGNGNSAIRVRLINLTWPR